MTKNDLQALQLQNGVRAVVWLTILSVLAIWTHTSVLSDFAKVGNSDSVAHYIVYLWVAFAVTILVTILWWISTTLCSGEVRNLVEERSFWCALVCVGIVFAAIGIILWLSHGIVDTQGHPQPSGHMLVFPFAFGCLMYWLPPANLEKVIWPFWTRLLPGLGMGVGLIIVAVTQYLLGG